MYTQKTFVLGKEDADKKWWTVDATDVVVGRLATRVAHILRGKHKPTFTPNQECGDFIVITNVDKMKFTGKKYENKQYHWHTGSIGGLKTRTARQLMENTPERVLFEAVKGMLPKTSLGRKQLTKLKVFSGDAHDHAAQNPEALNLNELK